MSDVFSGDIDALGVLLKDRFAWKKSYNFILCWPLKLVDPVLPSTSGISLTLQDLVRHKVHSRFASGETLGSYQEADLFEMYDRHTWHLTFGHLSLNSPEQLVTVLNALAVARADPVIQALLTAKNPMYSNNPKQSKNSNESRACDVKHNLDHSLEELQGGSPSGQLFGLTGAFAQPNRTLCN